MRPLSNSPSDNTAQRQETDSTSPAVAGTGPTGLQRQQQADSFHPPENAALTAAPSVAAVPLAPRQAPRGGSLAPTRQISIAPENVGLGGHILPPALLFHEAVQAWLQQPGLSVEEAQQRQAARIGLGGSCYLANFTAITTLPQGLRVEGDLDLTGCTAITALPQGLSVGDNLNLTGCTAITELPQSLSVRGNLNLRGCTAITALPQGLSVRYDLRLDGCTAITALPQGLSVRGSLLLEGCTAITQLPQGLSTGGNLYLNGCTAINALPKGLSVGRDLDLTGCTAITELPQGLSVGRDLDLTGCTAITELPQGLSVRGNLNLKGCTAITELPQGLSVRGNLNLKGCTAITALPQGLSVGDNLNLTGCTAITELPQGLSVRGNLDLRGCTAITALPQGLSVGRDLDLTGCTAITALPQGLMVGSLLDLRGCTAINALPEGLRVGGGLSLGGCTAINALPEGLSVGGHLDLSGCTAITELPQGLSVRGNLNLSGCTAITALPEGLSVGLNLNLSGCTAITSLPSVILSWGPSVFGARRIIDLTGSGISAEVEEALRRDCPPHMQFRHRHEPVSQRYGHDPAFQHYDATFATYTQAAAHYSHLGVAALAPARDGAVWTPAADEADALRLFLGRLPETADFRNVITRPALLQRLQGLLHEMQQDPSLTELGAQVLRIAVETCGDRVVQGMDQMELALAVRQAKVSPRPAQALHELGLALLRLQVVDRHAALVCQRLRYVDEVEVYLKFHTLLRERLGLPGVSASRLYGAEVSNDQLEDAARDAVATSADTAAQAAFFAAWTPWQQHLRATQAEATTWAHLAALTPGTALPEGLICPITQRPLNELEQPCLLLDGLGRPRGIFEHAELMTWWVEHGNDPSTREAFDLSKLVRVKNP